MQTESQTLFNLLVSKGFEVKTLDSMGKEHDDVSEAEMFSFDFTVGDSNYGPVVILLNATDEVELFYGDNIGKAMESEDKRAWMDFLHQIRMFAKRKLKGFKLNDISKLKYSMQGQAAIKEGLFEGYYGTSKTSYSPQGKAKIIIKHNKAMGEDSKRWYNIQSIFIENADGERFKLPFKKLAGARAMARHVQEGGTPYDIFGNHISEMVKDINSLQGFMRRSKMFEDDEETSHYVMAGREYYQTLRKKLKSLSGKRGYHMYTREWAPDQITQEEADVDAIRKLFTEKTLNSRVEEALPILARLTTGTGNNKMKEINEFESWADGVAEGTWALPETPEQVEALRGFMASDQPVGIDAMDATGKLYDIIGDDDLFDSLDELADRDPEADARPLVRDWLKRNEPGLLSQLGRNGGNGDGDSRAAESMADELDADTQQQLHASANNINDKRLHEALPMDTYDLDKLSPELRNAINDDLVSVYDILSGTIGFKPGPEELDIIERAYDEIGRDKGWHPDDDFDDICNHIHDIIGTIGEDAPAAPAEIAVNEMSDLSALLQITNSLLAK